MKSFNPLEVPPAGIKVNGYSGSPEIAEDSNPASAYFCLELGNAHRFCKRPPVWGWGGGVERFGIRMVCILNISLFWKFWAHARESGDSVFHVSCVELSQS